MNNSVAAVVLAYSRDDYLKKLLKALKDQTRKPDEIIVIYQGSRDETFDWIKSDAEITSIRQGNIGSAGGFATGIEEAVKRKHGWTWIFDDDAIPELDALEELVTRPCFSRQDTAFIGSRIVDRYGNTYMSPRGSDSQEWYGTVLEDRCIEAVDGCWLGLLVNSETVRTAGLPISEFFLWDEDREFISRLIEHGKGYCALGSVIKHYQTDSFDPFGKDYIKAAYYARNHVARQKMGSMGVFRKTARVLKASAMFTGRIARREIPFKTITWVFKGIFLFWPKVRYLD